MENPVAPVLAPRTGARRSRFPTTALVIGAVLLLLGWIGGGGEGHLFLAVGGSIVLALPAAVVAPFAILNFALRKPSLEKERARRTLGSVARGLWPSAIVLASVAPGEFVFAIDEARAKDWCMQLVPKLEEHRARYGEYPATLDGIADPKSGPRFIRRGGFMYGTSGGVIYFSIAKGFFSDWDWASDRRYWQSSSA